MILRGPIAFASIPKRHETPESHLDRVCMSLILGPVSRGFPPQTWPDILRPKRWATQPFPNSALAQLSHVMPCSSPTFANSAQLGWVGWELSWVKKGRVGEEQGWVRRELSWARADLLSFSWRFIDIQWHSLHIIAPGSRKRLELKTPDTRGGWMQRIPRQAASLFGQ